LGTDYFEDGDMDEYHKRGNTSESGIQTSTKLDDATACSEPHDSKSDVRDHSKALEMQLASSTELAAYTSLPSSIEDNLNDQVSKEDLTNYPKAEDIFHVWTRSDMRKSESNFLWAWQHPDVLTSNTNGYYAEFDWNEFDDRGGEVTFGRVIDGTFETLATISVRFDKDTWYQLEIEWNRGLSMDVEINDSDCNGLNSGSAGIEDRWDNGGIGFLQAKDSDVDDRVYFDHAWIDALESDDRHPE